MRFQHRVPNSPAAFCLIGLLVPALSTGCGNSSTSLPPEDPGRLTIKLTSSAFADGGMIPKDFTCDGSDQSPPLEWSDVPSSAHSLALICDDPDAPVGTWSHWVVFNLPPETKALGEGIPPEETIKLDAGNGRQGRNDFKNFGYGGPCPPRGTHRYYFRLYALDVDLKLTGAATRADLLEAVKGHILAEGRLLGKYQRGTKE